MGRIGGGGLVGLMVLFVIGMAMPWAVVSCESTELLEQSGFQVASGEVAEGKDFRALMNNLEQGEGIDVDSEEFDEMTAPIDGAVWLWAALAGSVLAGLGGVLLLLGRGSVGAMLGLGGAGVALIVLLASFGIGFPIEADTERRNKESAEESDGSELGELARIELKVERRGGFWLAVLASVGQLACAAVGFKGSRGQQESG